ncbi:MAG: arsenate reductase ArsC [Planctomycetaceae bacterium]
MTAGRRRVLFLCTGNSCRSQMAEGLLRHDLNGRFESLSAGSAPSGYVHPMAIDVMHEIAVDIAGQHSQSIQEFLPPAGTSPDLIISVCDGAAQNCPAFPGEVERLHWPFDDPAHCSGNAQDQRQMFRRVRDEIRAKLQEHFASD